MGPLSRRPPAILDPGCRAAAAGAPNFIALVFDAASLGACLDLNLPCFDATAYLAKPVPGGEETLFASAAMTSIV